MTVLISVLIFFSLALAGFAVSGWAREREEAKDALGRRLTTMTGTPIASATGSVMKDRRLSQIGLLNLLLGRLAVTSWFARMVQQAGLKRRVGEVVLYILLLASLAFLIVTLLTGRILFASIAALWAGLLPIFFVLRLRRKRRARFTEQLPDALDLIRAALQAGHGFLSALQVVAQEFPDPISSELTEVAEEVRLGMPLRDALQHMMNRMEDPNLPILTTGVIITQEIGGNLAEVLDNIGYTIRERFKLLREVRVMTAQGRLSGMVLTALPFIVSFCLFLFSREYFQPMIETQAGHLMILYALVSILIGHLVIQRIVRIEV